MLICKSRTKPSSQKAGDRGRSNPRAWPWEDPKAPGLHLSLLLEGSENNGGPSLPPSQVGQATRGRGGGGERWPSGKLQTKSPEAGRSESQGGFQGQQLRFQKQKLEPIRPLGVGNWGRQLQILLKLGEGAAGGTECRNFRLKGHLLRPQRLAGGRREGRSPGVDRPECPSLLGGSPASVSRSEADSGWENPECPGPFAFLP